MRTFTVKEKNFVGMTTVIDPRKIDPRSSPDMQDVMVKNGFLHTRPGYVKTGVKMHDAVLGMFRCEPRMIKPIARVSGAPVVRTQCFLIYVSNVTRGIVAGDGSPTGEPPGTGGLICIQYVGEDWELLWDWLVDAYPTWADLITAFPLLECNLGADYPDNLTIEQKICALGPELCESGAHWDYNDDTSGWEYSATGYITQNAIVDSIMPTAMKPILGKWKFEEASGAIEDDTDNDNDGTYNGASYQQTGQVGYALGFDGNTDEVTFGNIQLLADKAVCTVSAWIYLQSYHTEPLQQRTIAMDREGANMWQIFVYPSTHDPASRRRLGFSVWLDGSGYSGISSDVISLNTWTFVVGVYDGSEVIVYINGEQNGTKDEATGNIDSGSTEFLVGYGSFTGGSPWHGRIDELIIRQDALTAAKILEQYEDEL